MVDDEVVDVEVVGCELDVVTTDVGATLAWELVAARVEDVVEIAGEEESSVSDSLVTPSSVQPASRSAPISSAATRPNS